MHVTTSFIFKCMFFILRVSSGQYDQIKIPECDYPYMKHRMNSDDPKYSVFELEHFYTGIKYKVVDSMLDHPSSPITSAWETHIVHTSLSFHFAHSNFGRYVHYKLMEQDKGQLRIYHKLKNFGIKNMNETVWLLKTL